MALKYIIFALILYFSATETYAESQADDTPETKMATIKIITENQIKKVGDHVDLVCSVQNANEVPVMWKKVNEKGVTLITIGSITLEMNSRFSIRTSGVGDSESYILSIKNLQMSDAAIYTCQVVDPSVSAASANVKLEVEDLSS